MPVSKKLMEISLDVIDIKIGGGSLIEPEEEQLTLPAAALLEVVFLAFVGLALQLV